MISVCIATYNSSKYIVQQIESILSQLSADDEIVVSDDGSSDDTIQILDSFGDSRIKVFVNEGEHGYTSNFENALIHSKGDYIFLSDHDDVWKENKVEICMKYLKQNSFVVSDAEVTDENLQTLYSSYFEKRIVYENWIGNLYRFGYLGCLQCFHRSVLKKAIPFPKNHELCTHDNWLFMVGLTFFNVKIVRDQLMYYRRHTGTTSDGGNNEHKSTYFRVKYRLYLVHNLIMRGIRI